MSKILCEETKEIVYSAKKELLGIECDICKKTLPLPTMYFTVITGHHDWGTDSCESRIYRDVCPDCIDKYVNDYLKDCSDTGYIEINKERAYPGRLVDHDINDRWY